MNIDVKFSILNSQFSIILSLFLIIFVVSCEKKDCMKSAGATKKVVRYVENFDTIYLNDYFQIYLKTDTVSKIEIEAGENIIKNIKTDVFDNKLVVKDLNACGFIKGYKAKKITISSDNFSKIIIQDGVELYSVDTIKFDFLRIRSFADIGSCDLTVDGKQLYFSVWYASGKYTIRGKVDYANLSMLGMSSAHTYDLYATRLSADNNSLGNMYVRADKGLDAFIKNEGNIYYKGNPKSVNLKDSIGTGKLIKVPD